MRFTQLVTPADDGVSRLLWRVSRDFGVGDSATTAQLAEMFVPYYATLAAALETMQQVIDQDGPEILAKVKAISDKPIKYILNTHQHGDHTGGNAFMLMNTPAEILIHKNARANMVANNLALQLRWSSIGVFPTSGGLPIMVGDEMIGAIGVGGSNQDEECAYAALTSVVGPQPPLAEKLPPPPAR